MTDDMKERLERRRKELYATVKNARPDLYEAAIQCGHMALPEFGGQDPIRRAASVEACAMSLAAQAAGIEV